MTTTRMTIRAITRATITPAMTAPLPSDVGSGCARVGDGDGDGSAGSGCARVGDDTEKKEVPASWYIS